MRTIKTSEVISVVACNSGTSVTIAVRVGEPIVISGSVAEIQFVAEQIAVAAVSDAARRGPVLMETGP